MGRNAKTFTKGKSGNPAGKVKGTQNMITVLLKDAILSAAVNAGFQLKPDTNPENATRRLES